MQYPLRNCRGSYDDTCECGCQDKKASEPSQDDKPTKEELIELIQHCWVHSGYVNCGHRKMTTRQKEIFDSLTINLEF